MKELQIKLIILMYKSHKRLLILVAFYNTERKKYNMKFNIHAGHNPSKSIACGAVGLLDESKENRKILKRLKYLFKRYNITVFDCTCNKGKNQNDVLLQIVKKENLNNVDFNISLHFNSGRNNLKYEDNNLGGSEIWVHTNSSIETRKFATMILKYLVNESKYNRGVKCTNNLFILNAKPKNSLLIEICFVDDKDDFNLYNARRYANAIFLGIVKYIIFTNNEKFKKKYHIEKDSDFNLYVSKTGKFFVEFTHSKKKLNLYKYRKDIIK